MKVTVKKNNNKFIPVTVELTFEKKDEVTSVIEASRSVDDGYSIDDGEHSQEFYNVLEKLATALKNSKI